MSSRNRWINRLVKRSAVASAAAAAASTLLSSSAWATSGTWITTSGAVYNTPGAWIFGAPNVPNGSTDAAFFNFVNLSPGFAANPLAVQQLTVDLQQSYVTLGQLVFADVDPSTPGSYKLLSTGNVSTLALDNGAATPIINVGNMGALTPGGLSGYVEINVPIIIKPGAAAGLVKTGAGELRMTKANDFGGGGLAVNGGTLTVGNLNQIGNISSTITMGGGTLALRNDGTVDMSTFRMNVTANSGIYVDRALGSNLSNQNVIDKIGTIAFTAGGVRMSVGGASNGYGLSIGTLLFNAGGNSFFTDLASGAVTIGNVTATGGGTLNFTGTGDSTSGSDLTITGSISQSGTQALNVIYNDIHTLSVNSFGSPAPTGILTVTGGGTLSVTGTSAMIPSATVTISNGTLDFSNATLQSVAGTLAFGSNGATAAYLKMGSGGLKLTGNTVSYSGGTSTNPGAPAVITGAPGAILTLSPSTSSTFSIGRVVTSTGNPGQDMLIDIAVAATGAIQKTGAGELVLSGANQISGTINVAAGTLTTVARQSGSSLGASTSAGTLIIQSGTYRLLSNSAQGGSASVGTMQFTGDTAPAQLLVDASGAGVGDATLNIGTFGTRVSGTGVLTIIPVKGPLDGNEHIHVTAFNSQTDPANNHGIVAPFVVTQKSAANMALDFVGLTGGNNLTTANYAAYTGSQTGGTAVVVDTIASPATTTAAVFAMKVDGDTINDPSSSLTIGDGNRGGLILNNGAVLGVTSLAFNAKEAVVWSGGTATGGTVNSPFTLSGGTNNLTTGGPQTLTLAGDINLGGGSRTFTVGSGTTVITANVSAGSLYKTGPGVLALTNSNPGLNGLLTVSAGTVSIGVGADGSLGVSSASTGETSTGIGTLQFNLSGARTITNFISGAGTVLQNSSTGGILTLHSSTPSTYSNLAILSGGVQLSSNTDIPSSTTISVSGGSLDLNGFSPSSGALAGGIARDSGNTPISTGLITNSSGNLSVLTLSPSVTANLTTNATYSGNINGGAFMRIVKNGAGTQQLGGNNDFTGGVVISNGTLIAASNTALGHDASVILNNTNGGVLRLDGVTGPTLPASLSFSIAQGTTGTISVGTSSANGAVNGGTILGSVVGGGGTLAINNESAGGQLTVGPGVLDGMVDPVFGVGTVLLVNGGLRFFTAASNVGNTSLNFNMQGTGSITTVNVATLRLGRIQGGANTTINLAGGSVVQLGLAGGAQVFGGTITGGTGLTKSGLGTVQINTSTQGYTGVTNIDSGTLILNNAVLSGTPTININAPLVMAGGASISGSTQINLSEAFPFDVTSHNSWTTPASVTVRGTGLIAGAYKHNAGSFIPGGDGTFGTIIFNTASTPNTLTMGDNTATAAGSAGVTLLDYSSVGAVGSGTNDLIQVFGNLTLNQNALYRVNNTNTITNFSAGQTYPTFLYTGTQLSGTPGTVLPGTVQSAFRGSFAIVASPDDPNFPTFHIASVKVVTFNTNPLTSTWIGSTSGTWDLNITKNFVNSTEGKTTFYQGDSIVFDNTVLLPANIAASKSINLSNGLILPGTLTFGNTSNLLSYTVQGNGIIGGGARVLVNGGGTVTFASGGNSYTGGTVVNSGYLVGSGGGQINVNGNFGVGSVLLNGGATGQSATLVFANNALIAASDLYTPTGQMANLVSQAGSMSTGGQMFGTFTLQGGANTGPRWDMWTYLQKPGDAQTGTLLINNSSTIRLMRPYAGAGLFFNFVAGSGGLATNLFDPLNDQVQIGGIAGVGGGNIVGFTGGNAAWYKAFVIGAANADSTWGGQITDSFGRAPATGGGGNATGISNTHAPTAITKVGSASLRLTGVSVLMSGDLTVNQGTMIVDNTDPFLGTRDGGGLFVWATRVQVSSGATFQMGSGGSTGTLGYIGDNSATSGTFLQASSTGAGVSWNANNGTFNVRGGYNTTPAGGLTTGGGGGPTLSLNTQYSIDPNLTISGSGASIYGSIRMGGGTLSPGDGGSGRFGTMSIIGADASVMQDPTNPLDPGQSTAMTSSALNLAGGALVFDVGTQTSQSDRIAIANVGGSSGNFNIGNVASNKIVVDFNGSSAAAGQKYTLMTYNSLSGTFAGAAGPKLILNGRNATGTLVASGNSMLLSITTAASASNIQWASSNGTWDVGSWAPGATKNWANLDGGSVGDYFYHGDTITFNPNTVPGGTVNIGGSVAPAKITVNTDLGTSAVAYTFAGQGRITGNTALVKNGNGTLTLRTVNDYSGGTTINAGTLELGAAWETSGVYSQILGISATGPFVDSNRQGDAGTGSITIGSGATLAYRADRGGHITQNIVGPGKFVMDQIGAAVRFDTAGSWTGGTTMVSGYISLGVDNAIPTTGSLNILTTSPHPTTGSQGGFGGRFDLNEHSQSIDELYGNGAFSVIMNQGSLSILNPTTTFSVGSGNFVGDVHQGQEGGTVGSFSQIAFVKYSTGTLTMNYIGGGGTINTSMSGLTEVKGGVLVIRGLHEPNNGNNSVNTSIGSYTVHAGGQLSGDGVIRSGINVDPTGIIDPGLPDPTVHTGGTLTVNGLNLNSAILKFDVRGLDNDQLSLQANNGLNALGTSTINITVDPTFTQEPNVYTLLDYRGSALQNYDSKFSQGTITNGANGFTYKVVHNTALTEIDLVVTQPALTSTWNLATGGGSWGVATNWSTPGTLQLPPNAADSMANLTAPNTMSQDATITIDTTVSLATLNLSTANGHNFVVNPLSGGAFNFSTTSTPGVGIVVTSGNHFVNAPTVFTRDATVSVAGSSQLTLLQSLDAAGLNVTKTGSGKLVVGNIRNTAGFDGSTNFRITSGTVQLNHYTQSNLVNGASKVNVLSIDSGGTLDITNNLIAIDYTGGGNGSLMLHNTRDMILNTHKIMSSEPDPTATHAIGYRDNQGLSLNVNDPPPSAGTYRTFNSYAVQGGAGVSTDATTIIVKYTYKGDTNLDGAVDLSDLLNVATHYNKSSALSGNPDGWLWQQGDFNGDGQVTTADLQYIGTNWLQGTGSVPGTQLSPILLSLGLPNIAVPEPTALGLVGIGLTGLMARRRRRRS